jgi:glycosyltransferase involved in cell wall biosynthesis
MPDIADSPAIVGFTIVVPCFNEADNIAAAHHEMVTELGSYDIELMFVDDGSTDQTLEILHKLAASDPRVQYLSLTRNFGIEAAFSAGYRYASKPWLLHADADMQFPMTEVHKLIAEVETGQDAVFGIRQRRDDPLVRRWGSRAYHFAGRRLLGIELPRGATTFRMMRSVLARRIVDLRLGTPYFLATVPRLTNRYSTVPVTHRARQHGRSKLHLRWLVGHAMGLYVGFSNRMATIASVTGLLAAVLAMLASVGAAAGVLSPVATAVLLLALLGVVMVILAVLMRYLVMIGSGQPRPRLFYIRQASIPVESGDLLLPDLAEQEAA